MSSEKKLRYRARQNEVIDTQEDRQIVVLLGSNCTKKRTAELAKMLAQAMNKEARHEQ